MDPGRARSFARQWGTLLSGSLAAEKERLVNLRVERPPHMRIEYEDIPEFKHLKSSGRQLLERFDRGLKFQYTAGGVRLGYLQVRTMKSIKTSLVKILFRAQLLGNTNYLLTVHDIQEIYDAVVILFPRRSGKTTVQTIAGAAIGVSQPDGNVVSFNITGRQARMWLSQCRKYLMTYMKSDEFRFEVIAENMNEFVKIKSVATGTINTICAYPGSQGKDFKNLRGVGENLCMCFVDEGYWFSEEGVPVLVPLLANGAALVITSSVGSGGPRAGLMAILDAQYGDGTMAVKEINYSTTCEECIAANIPEGRCTHNYQRPQHFQSNFSQLRTKVLLSPFEGVHERELLNRQDKPPTEPVWSTRAITNMFDESRDLEPIEEYGHAFTSIDPHGGGETSDSAISTFVRTRINGRWTYLVHFYLFYMSAASIPSRSPSRVHRLPMSLTKSCVMVLTRPGPVVTLRTPATKTVAVSLSASMNVIPRPHSSVVLSSSRVLRMSCTPCRPHMKRRIRVSKANRRSETHRTKATHSGDRRSRVDMLRYLVTRSSRR